MVSRVGRAGLCLVVVKFGALWGSVALWQEPSAWGQLAGCVVMAWGGGASLRWCGYLQYRGPWVLALLLLNLEPGSFFACVQCFRHANMNPELYAQPGAARSTQKQKNQAFLQGTHYFSEAHNWHILNIHCSAGTLLAGACLG